MIIFLIAFCFARCGASAEKVEGLRVQAVTVLDLKRWKTVKITLAGFSVVCVFGFITRQASGKRKDR
jgi:hypothetical protein